MTARFFALMLIYVIAALTWALHLSWAQDSAQPVAPILAVILLSIFVVVHDDDR